MSGFEVGCVTSLKIPCLLLCSRDLETRSRHVKEVLHSTGGERPVITIVTRDIRKTETSSGGVWIENLKT